MNKTSEPIKEILFTVVEQLSEEAIREVLDFTESLLAEEGVVLASHARERIRRLEQKSSPEDDPIFEYIGGVSHGALAKNIDDELYGGKS